MESSRKNADRVRPILAAMERSIDAARRKRTNVPGAAPAQPVRPSQEAPQPRPNSRPSPPMSENSEDKPDFARMKARPKRSPHLNDHTPPYRSAG